MGFEAVRTMVWLLRETCIKTTWSKRVPSHQTLESRVARLLEIPIKPTLILASEQQETLTSKGPEKCLIIGAPKYSGRF